MRRVQALHVRARLLRPLVDNIGAASRATDFVRQFPRKDRSAALIPIHYRLDIRLILRLHPAIRVPLRLRCDVIVGVVRRHSTIVVPVIHEGDDELDAVALGALDDVIEALETVGASVDLWALARDERLEPDGRSG